MAPKKKPTKKPVTPKAEEAIPGDVAHGRARDAAETQAESVQAVAIALDVLGCGVSRLAAALVEVPMDGASRLERLVVAAERFAEAHEVKAWALADLADAHARQATVDEAESSRRAELHAVELADRKARVEWRSRIASVREGEAAPRAYEGGTATPIVAVSTPAEPASPQA